MQKKKIYNLYYDKNIQHQRASSIHNSNGINRIYRNYLVAEAAEKIFKKKH